MLAENVKSPEDYIPVRSYFEAKLSTVVWSVDGNTQKVTITKDDDTVVFTVGSAVAIVNGVSTQLDGAVYFNGEKVFVLKQPWIWLTNPSHIFQQKATRFLKPGGFLLWIAVSTTGVVHLCNYGSGRWFGQQDPVHGDWSRLHFHHAGCLHPQHREMQRQATQPAQNLCRSQQRKGYLMVSTSIK